MPDAMLSSCQSRRGATNRSWQGHSNAARHARAFMPETPICRHGAPTHRVTFMNATPPTADPMETLLRILELSDAGGAQTDEDIFVGLGDANAPRPRLFGGQVLAQSLVAAARTVGSEHLMHSMHGYFLRPGDAAAPHHLWCSAAARRPVLLGPPGARLPGRCADLVDDRLVPAPRHGIEHQDTMPEGIPAPETLPTSAELLGAHQPPRGPGVGVRAPLRHPPRWRQHLL